MPWQLAMYFVFCQLTLKKIQNDAKNKTIKVVYLTHALYSESSEVIWSLYPKMELNLNIYSLKIILFLDLDSKIPIHFHYKKSGQFLFCVLWNQVCGEIKWQFNFWVNHRFKYDWFLYIMLTSCHILKLTCGFFVLQPHDSLPWSVNLTHLCSR